MSLTLSNIISNGQIKWLISWQLLKWCTLYISFILVFIFYMIKLDHIFMLFTGFKCLYMLWLLEDMMRLSQLLKEFVMPVNSLMNFPTRMCLCGMLLLGVIRGPINMFRNSIETWKGESGWNKDHKRQLGYLGNHSDFKFFCSCLLICINSWYWCEASWEKH